jgi:hypothetical protein
MRLYGTIAGRTKAVPSGPATLVLSDVMAGLGPAIHEFAGNRRHFS